MSMVLTERRGAVLLITLNDPASYNSMAGTMMRDLHEALTAGDADQAVRAIVVTGAGKGFCSGANLKNDTFSSGAGIGEGMRRGINPILAAMRAIGTPIVVAVNGAAAGAGVGLALAGDIVLAARSARFILSFSRLGAAVDGGASQIIQAAIGAPRARALAMLAEPLHAETAAAWGLIWKVVEDEALMIEAMAIADKLAAGPPVSLALIKGQVEDARTLSYSEALDAEATAQSKAFATEDLREGAAAFVAKRAPNFRGR